MKKGLAGIFVLLVLVSVFGVGVIGARASGGERGGFVVKREFVLYPAAARQGGLVFVDLGRAASSSSYFSVGGPVAILSKDFSGMSSQDIKDEFAVHSPMIVLGNRVSLGCYFVPGSKVDIDSSRCAAPLDIGDNGIAPMVGWIILAVPNPNDQSRDFFAFVPDDGSNPVFGEREVLPTPIPYPTETAVVEAPTPSAQEVENALSSQGLETVVADKQIPLDKWVEEVSKDRGLNVADVKAMNGMEFTEEGNLVGSMSVKGAKIGGVKIPFTGIRVGGKLFTIPGVSKLFVPKISASGGLEIVDISPAVFDIAKRMGKTMSAVFSKSPIYVEIHDTAIKHGKATVLDVETSCFRRDGEPCYNYMVDYDGTIYLVTPVGYRYLGVGYSGDKDAVAISFNTSPKVNGGVANAEQQASAVRLAAYLAKTYSIDPLRVDGRGVHGIYGHVEYPGATHHDPVGVDMDAFRRKVADLLSSGSSSLGARNPASASLRPFQTPQVSQAVPTPSATPEVAKGDKAGGFTRALWVDAYHSGIESKSSIDRLVGYCVQNNIELLFVSVQRRELAYLFKGGPKASPGNFDALGELLKRTKPLGIEVHAWIDSGWKEGVVAPDFTDERVREYVKSDIVKPLLLYEDLAGIHIDRMRLGNNDEATESQRASITSLVGELHDMVSAKGKKLSVAAICWGAAPSINGFKETAPYRLGQDWESWVLRGYVDMLVPMNYAESKIFDGYYKRWLDFQVALARKVNVPVISGLADYLSDEGTPANLEEQVSYAKDVGASGVAFFSYASLVNSGRSLPPMQSAVESPKTAEPAPNFPDDGTLLVSGKVVDVWRTATTTDGDYRDTQFLYGWKVKAKGKQANRTFVESKEYSGWVDSRFLVKPNSEVLKAWGGSDKVVVVQAKTSEGFYYGTVLPKVSEDFSSVTVLLVDGTTAKLPKHSVERYYLRALNSLSSQAILSEAMKFEGAPYLWGGVTVDGTDCSGFPFIVLRRFGVEDFPRDSGPMYEYLVREGFGVSAPIKVGDWLFYKGHVAIYLGKGGWGTDKIFEAEGGSIVLQQTYGSFREAGRFEGATRFGP